MDQECGAGSSYTRRRGNATPGAKADHPGALFDGRRIMLPSFLLIGAQKCGTSSLASQLGAHPQVFMAPRKELDFFSMDENWNRGITWYESFFREATGEKAIGEASASYTMHPMFSSVPGRIAEKLPDARFLYIIRHPVKRIISNYMLRWYEDQMDDSLEAMVESHPQLLTCSRYHHQIEQYLPFFPRDRFLVILFEEFVADPPAIHKEIFRFLGVDTSFVVSDTRPKNVTADRVIEAPWMRAVRRIPLIKAIAKTLLPTPFIRRITRLGGVQKPQVEMPAGLRDKLVDELRPDIEALSDFAQRDFSKIWNLGVG